MKYGHCKLQITLTTEEYRLLDQIISNKISTMESSAQKKRLDVIITKLKALTSASIASTSSFVEDLTPSEWNLIFEYLAPVDEGIFGKKDLTKSLKIALSRKIRDAFSIARMKMIMTTGDIHDKYEIISPIYFQISNKGIFTNDLKELSKKYIDEISQMRSEGIMSEIGFDSVTWFLEWSTNQSYFEQAFYIAVQELKRRAMLIDADAIVCMRQDIDMDTNGFQFFYLQMYGTAVQFTD